MARIVAKYLNSLANWRDHGRTLYRSKEEREDQVKLEGGPTTASIWFKALGYNNTLTLPATKESGLLEDGGTSMKQELVETNPFPEITCSVESSRGKYRLSGIN